MVAYGSPVYPDRLFAPYRFIAHDRRQFLHGNVTAHPTAAWGWRQLIDATAWGHRPR